MDQQVKFAPLRLDIDLVDLLKKAMDETQPIKDWDNESYNIWVKFLKSNEDNKSTNKKTAEMIRSLLDTEKNKDNCILDSDLRKNYYKILDGIGFTVGNQNKIRSQVYLEKFNKRIASYTTVYDRILAKEQELVNECDCEDVEFQENMKFLNDYKEFTDRLRQNSTQYKKATQYFLGQLILPQFINARKKLK